MTKMILPMAAMPAAIANSVASVLNVHGLSLSANLLGEIGRNTTQALFDLDENLTATVTVYEIPYRDAYKLRAAYQANSLTDAHLLAAVDRLEGFLGTADDIADLCHLAELAELPWRDMFPDVIPGSPAPSPHGEANERGAAEVLQPAAPRSSCTPSSIDLRIVGETLRALAAGGQPNAHTAPVLGRVGDWLRDLAIAELEEGKAA